MTSGTHQCAAVRVPAIRRVDIGMRKIAIVVVLLLTASIAPAQPPMVKYLQLTPEQVTAWKQIRSETAAPVKPLRANAQELRRQLQAALNAPSPQPAAVGKLALQLHGLRGQIRAAREASRTRLSATVNAAQKSKFNALQAASQFQRQARRRGR